MSSTMLVHDSRLAGTPPAHAANIYPVNGSTPLSHALAWIGQYARANGGLSRLLILCHGMESGVHDSPQQICDHDLGFGLLLCRENLTLRNVAQTSVLKPHVQQILLYACGPARTRPGFRGTAADGSRFCSELAAHTGAVVYGATHTQWYTRSPSPHLLQRLFRIGPQDYVDFGAWEGRVLRFVPDGAVTLASGG